MEEKEEQNNQPVYIRRFPFRFVQPYPHTYRTFAKGRWIGKPLLLTLQRQFKAYPPEYYEDALANGRIKVNGKVVGAEYILQHSDAIEHVSIRVEPPVLDLPIEVVHESDDFLVVNKPPSVIVHTGGGHHFNTVEKLLQYQLHYTNLHILHRLDKCTSGLLIFAKDKQKVGAFHEESKKETMKKMYYARVAGNFQWQEKELHAYIECLSHKDGVYKVTQQIEQEQHIPQQKNIKENISEYHKNVEQQKDKAKQEQLAKSDHQEKTEQGQQPKQDEKPKYGQKHQQKEKQTSSKRQKKGLGEDNSDIKDSKTFFRKVWYDEQTDSSLLECYPITGRTHQIRVHLQFLGFPILNDVVYGGRFVGNRIIQTIPLPASQETEEGQPKKKVKLSEQLRAEDWDYETRPWQIMLHSYRYTFGGQAFKTNVPYWFFRQSLGPNTLHNR